MIPDNQYFLKRILLTIALVTLFPLLANAERVSLSEMQVDIPVNSNIEYCGAKTCADYTTHDGIQYAWVYAHTFEFAANSMTATLDKPYRMMELKFFAVSDGDSQLRVIDDTSGIVIAYLEAGTNDSVQERMINIEGVTTLRFEFDGKCSIVTPILDSEQGTIENSKVTIEKIQTQENNLLRYIDTVDDDHVPTIDSSMLFQNDIIGFEYGINGGDTLRTITSFALPANKFKFLTFQAFCLNRLSWEETAVVDVIDLADNNRLLGTVTITDNQYPKRLTVDITGVEELGIRMPNNSYAVVAEPQLSVSDFTNLTSSVFTADEYSIEVVRDYMQHVDIELLNTRSNAISLKLRVANRPNEIPIDFIGLGNNLTDVFSLEPRERRVVTLAIHAQRAVEREYNFFLEAIDANDDTPLGGAGVQLSVNQGNINFSLVETGYHPGTLIKTLLLTNAGDAISDFTVSLDENLKDIVAINPTFTDLRLEKDGSLELTVAPLLSEAHLPATGNLTVQGAGMRQTISLTFAVGGSFRIFGVAFEDILPEVLKNKEQADLQLISMSSPPESADGEGNYKMLIEDTKTDMSFSYDIDVVGLTEAPADMDELTVNISKDTPNTISVELHYYVERPEQERRTSKDGLQYVADEIKFHTDSTNAVTGGIAAASALADDIVDMNNAAEAMHSGNISGLEYSGYVAWKMAKNAVNAAGLVSDPASGIALGRVGQFLDFVDGKLQDDMGIGDGTSTAKIEAFTDFISNTCINQGSLAMDLAVPPAGGSASMDDTATVAMRFEQSGSTPVREDVDLSINDNEVWSQDDFQPGNSLAYPEVPTRHLNVPGNNRMTFRNVSHDYTGYYTALVERRMYIPLTDLIINVVAASQEHAISIAPEAFGMSSVRLSAPDFAIFESGIEIESDTPRARQPQTINLTIHNMGSAAGLVNVKVTDLRDFTYRTNIPIDAFSKEEIAVPWRPSAPGTNSLLVTLNPGHNGEIVSYDEHYKHNNRMTKSVEIAIALPPVDTDNDGIDDNWELIYFEDLTRVTPESDSDGDGYSDLFEYQMQEAGETDPDGNTYNPTVMNSHTGETDPDDPAVDKDDDTHSNILRFIPGIVGSTGSQENNTEQNSE